MNSNSILPSRARGLGVALRQKGAVPVLVCALAIAGMLPAPAKADAFSARNNELSSRITALEAQITELREAKAQQAADGAGAQPGAVAGQPDLALPPPPEPAVQPEEFEPHKGFTLLAEINGQYFVKDGATHRLLDAEAFERFKKVRATYPAAAPTVEPLPAAPAPASAPPAPPPPVAPAAKKPTEQAAAKKPTEQAAAAKSALPAPDTNKAAARNAVSKKAAKKAADRK